MEPLEESSGIIDADGNLFGVINIIDALVIVGFLTVLLAGVGLVFLSDNSGSAGSQPEAGTVNVTIDLGPQPDYIVSQIEVGDKYSPGGNSNLTVRDVYFTPQGKSTRAVIRAELSAPFNRGTVQYGGKPPRYGRQLKVLSDTYATTGVIQDVGGGAEFTTTQTEVLVKTNLSETEARQLRAGQSVRVENREMATIESVTTYGTSNPDRKTVFVGLTLQTVAQNGNREFGDTTLRPGANLTLPTESVYLEGEIERVGATSQRGERANRQVTLEMSGVSSTVAESVSPGMTESYGETTVAEITDVERESTTVITRGENGTIYERDHPTEQDMTLTATLSVRETDTGVTFKGQTLQQGRVITLDLGTVTIKATVVSGINNG
ncbi:DUF4330 family protein [Haloarcula salina]|uniref:DUF4330 family protein n=1 Tax=Haloarcula salina TaxID=1429914 RepID=UPI003C702E60